MDGTSGSRRDEIRVRHEQERRNLQEIVGQIPDTCEAYLNKTPIERLDIAKKLLAIYAPLRGQNRRADDLPDDRTGINFELDTEDPHIRDSVRIAYDIGRWRTFNDQIFVDKYPAIKVWVAQIDITDELPLEFFPFGEIEFGPYVVDSGEYVHEAHALLGLDNRQPLEHEDAEYMIRLIDEAICRLIDGPIAKRRAMKVAKEALERVLEERGEKAEALSEQPAEESAVETPDEEPLDEK